MRRSLLACVIAAVAVGGSAHASEWGSIVPGSTTMEAVRGQYGGPTKATTQKVDNYDTASWVYEAAQAPTGLNRMVIDFGILDATGYKRDVVRSFKLEPKPGVFNRPMIIYGWGNPDRVGKQPDGEVFFYGQGLVVIFDKEGWDAQTLVFTPPQPVEPAKPSR